MRIFSRNIKITPENSKILGIPFLLFGIAAFVLAMKSYSYTKEFVDNAINVTGIVVSNEVCEIGNEGHSGNTPIVDFQTEGGIEVELRNLYCEDPPRFTVGEKVNLLYINSDPEHAQVAENDYLYIWTAIYVFFSLIFTTIALYILITKGKVMSSMGAAKFIGGSLIFFGLLMWFGGSPLWYGDIHLIQGGGYSIAFGIAIILWEKYRSTRL
jgi:hypothetical protein